MERDSCIFFIIFAIDDLKRNINAGSSLSLGILKNTYAICTVFYCLNCVFQSVNAADDDIVASCCLCCGKSAHAHVIVLTDDRFQIVAVSGDPVFCKSHSFVSLPVCCLCCNYVEVVKKSYFLKSCHTSNLSGLSHRSFNDGYFVAFLQAGFFNKPCSQKFSGFLVSTSYECGIVGVCDIAVINNDRYACVICHSYNRSASLYVLGNYDQSVYTGCQQCLAVADLFVYISAGVIYDQFYAQLFRSCFSSVYDSCNEHIGVVFG